MAKKLIFLLVFAVLLLPFINAIPPVQAVIGFEKGINIEYPKFDNIPQLENFHLFAQVFNVSDGLLLDNSTTNCSLHIYAQNGTHVIADDFSYSLVYDDFNYLILGGNFTKGLYSYTIQCQSEDIGGAVSGLFRVTYSGESITTAQAILYCSLISIFFFFFVMVLYFIGKLPDKSMKDGENGLVEYSWLKYVKSIMVFVSYLLVIAILYVGSNLAFCLCANRIDGTNTIHIV